MKLVRGIAVGLGATALVGLSGGSARAADTVTVDSVVVLTSSTADTATLTTVGQQWTLGSTALLFQTTICGELHCESTGTFTADDGHGDGVTGTFSSSL